MDDRLKQWTDMIEPLLPQILASPKFQQWIDREKARLEAEHVSQCSDPACKFLYRDAT